ncbi:MAG: carboxypeptidase regulatory-like domain-containing protein [Deltaproteobacteria bacterium]|nr:carboxypeptidase regulatory-like domain-containing protein [Deltaproteobacteria bacterium]
MKKNLLGILALAIACTIPALLMNCGEDEPPATGDGGGGGGGDTGGSDGGVTIEDAGEGQPKSISGTVTDFQSKQPVADVTVELYDDDNGASLGISGTSGADGTITLDGIPASKGKVGVKTTKADNMDTIQYHFDSGATGETFYIISQTTVSLIAGILGVTIDPAKGVAAGSVYYGPSTDEEPIGCATVATDPAGGEIHYMDNSGIPTKDRDTKGTNPKNGYFSILNMEPGAININATVGGATESSILPKLDANTVAISNVRFLKDKYAANPQPAACE